MATQTGDKFNDSLVEGGEENAAQQAEFSLGEQPMLLSQFLATRSSVNEAVRKAFRNEAVRLGLKNRKSGKESTWLKDYLVKRLH